jgi:ABC-type polysaccharide/polyol phosphate export permease
MIFLEATDPNWRALAKLAALSVVVFLGGHAWFYKLRKSFADLL